MSEAEIDRYAKMIWYYILMHQQLKKAAGIIVFGAKDIRAAYERIVAMGLPDSL